ncbi:MAG TPA: ABC transporter permease [Pyrinomonadaceae bacterium]|jgi:putative ABC transport system permease protein|nr:ABC transporter permease [Pyrinomonadaceae bacterium]
MGILLQDLRYGVRMLLKRPGFTLVAVLTLALGISANTAIFSVVNAVVLRPLPFAEPDRLVQVWETMPGNDKRWVAPGNFVDWQKQNQVFEEIAGYSSAAVNMTGEGLEPERLTGAAITANLFQTLGVAPLIGRSPVAEDLQQRDGRVVVLSHGLWQRRFGSDTNVAGRSLRLDEKSYTIIGVMPSGFSFPAKAEFWIPGSQGSAVPPSLAAQFPKSDLANERDIHIFAVVGRLRPNVTLSQAQAEMSTISQRLASTYPETNDGLGTNVIPLHQQVVGGVRPILFILLGAVALVLLIACTNVANLLLARATQRERELAIRLALGAGRFRLIRQMLTESLLLSLTGGIIGLLVAMWGVDLFVGLSPGDIPRLNEVGLDVRLLGFTLLVSLVTGIGFGLLPALQATRLDPQHALKEGGRSATEGRARRRTRNLLVVTEIALAQVLLIGAGLLIASFLRLQAVDPGFNPENLLTARLSLSKTKYTDSAKQIAFYNEVLGRLKAMPGVRSAALVMNLPLSGANMNRGFTVEGRPEPKPDENITVDYQVTSPDYFAAMEIPLVRGRAFTDQDKEGQPRVAIINEVMARKYFPGEDPVGKRILIGDAEKEDSWLTVVGIAGNVRHASTSEPAFPGLYTPYTQDRESWPRMAIVLRTNADPAALSSAVRKEILAIDPQQPVSNIQPMTQLMSESITRPRFITLLLGVLASIALALAVVGIYGLMSYGVIERTHEIGIRMALGAQRGDVLKMVVGHGLKLILAGLLIGVVGAFALTRLMTSLLFDVSAVDPLTFVVVSALLTLAALAACYIPARRATRVDPMVALRYE